MRRAAASGLTEGRRWGAVKPRETSWPRLIPQRADHDALRVAARRTRRGRPSRNSRCGGGGLPGRHATDMGAAEHRVQAVAKPPGACRAVESARRPYPTAGVCCRRAEAVRPQRRRVRRSGLCPHRPCGSAGQDPTACAGRAGPSGGGRGVAVSMAEDLAAGLAVTEGLLHIAAMRGNHGGTDQAGRPGSARPTSTRSLRRPIASRQPPSIEGDGGKVWFGRSWAWNQTWCEIVMSGEACGDWSGWSAVWGRW